LAHDRNDAIDPSATLARNALDAGFSYQRARFSR